MLANIWQRRPLGSQRTLKEMGYTRLFKFSRQTISPKVTVGDDGCHSRQWAAFFFILEITVLSPHVWRLDSWVLQLMKLALRICKLLSSFCLHADIKQLISHCTHPRCTECNNV